MQKLANIGCDFRYHVANENADSNPGFILHYGQFSCYDMGIKVSSQKC